MSLTSTIVRVNATVTAAPTPSTYQQSGALVSVGGTTLTTNAYQFCANLAAVTAIQSGSGNSVELGHMATTFFAQQSATLAPVGVYVVELGAQGSASAGIAALEAWIIANPGIFYAYLTPATWDSAGSTYNTDLGASFSSVTSQIYFFATTTSGTISAYSAQNKAIVTFVPSPTAASSEFGAAALFYQWLANSPSAASPLAPMAFRFVYGVTPWTLANNVTTINSILTAYGNIILTGAEGGISTATIRNGTTVDGNQMGFWYAIDWLAINAQQSLAAAIIDGSNENPPLYYNQAGINRLLAVLVDLGNTWISDGMGLSATFSAIPFSTYVTANPTNYAAGIYNGFSCIATPQTGFISIEFFLDATQFAA